MCIRDRYLATLREYYDARIADGLPGKNINTMAPVLASVSYTHLDVYKRQDPARLIGVGVTLPGTYDPARRVLDYAPAIGVFGPVEIGPWMDGMTQKFGVPVYVENDTNAQCMGCLLYTSRCV